MTTQHHSSLVTIGLDLGDRRHHYCVLDSAGTIGSEAAIPNTRECLAQLSANFPSACFVMETGTHSPWVSRLLEARGHRVIVANARKLRAISTSHTKTDTEDARMLARLGRADPQLLSPIRHRSEPTQRALVRLKVREALVRNRVALINSTRFSLKSLGVFISSSIKAMAFTKKVRAQLSAADITLVAELLASIDQLNGHIRQLDEQLEAIGTDQHPVTLRLRQIPGVGPLTALCFVLTIEDPNHFVHAQNGPVIQKRRLARSEGMANLSRWAKDHEHVSKIVVCVSHSVVRTPRRRTFKILREVRPQHHQYVGAERRRA